jgi:hypothetical protein
VLVCDCLCLPPCVVYAQAILRLCFDRCLSVVNKRYWGHSFDFIGSAAKYHGAMLVEHLSELCKAYKRAFSERSVRHDSFVLFALWSFRMVVKYNGAYFSCRGSVCSRVERSSRRCAGPAFSVLLDSKAFLGRFSEFIQLCSQVTVACLSVYLLLCSLRSCCCCAVVAAAAAAALWFGCVVVIIVILLMLLQRTTALEEDALNTLPALIGYYLGTESSPQPSRRASESAVTLLGFLVSLWRDGEPSVSARPQLASRRGCRCESCLCLSLVRSHRWRRA